MCLVYIFISVVQILILIYFLNSYCFVRNIKFVVDLLAALTKLCGFMNLNQIYVLSVLTSVWDRRR